MNNSINVLHAQDDIENPNDDGNNYDNDDVNIETSDKRISNTLLNSSNDNLRLRDDLIENQIMNTYFSLILFKIINKNNTTINRWPGVEGNPVKVMIRNKNIVRKVFLYFLFLKLLLIVTDDNLFVLFRLFYYYANMFLYLKTN